MLALVTKSCLRYRWVVSITILIFLVLEVLFGLGSFALSPQVSVSQDGHVTGVLSNEFFAENCPAHKLVSAPKLASKHHRNVVVSVILWKRWDLFLKMFTTLVASDIFKASNVHLVVYFNQVQLFGLNKKLDQLVSVMNSHSHFASVISIESQTNDGIVIPRMCIMQYALSLRGSDKANFLVEGHDDMIFTESWFEPLMEHFKPHVGLLMPFLWNGYDPSMTPNAFAAAVAPLRQRLVFQNCLQVHPWVINLEMVRKIGYFDKRYSPMEVEDDDFYYRVIQAGYVALSVKSSWVGQVISRRDGWEDPNDADKNKHMFLTKFKISVQEFSQKVLSHCHAVYNPIAKNAGISLTFPKPEVVVRVAETPKVLSTLLPASCPKTFACRVSLADEALFNKKCEAKGKKLVVSIVGTRPEAIKMSPVILELQKRSGIVSIVVATGQHVGVMLHDILTSFGISIDVSFESAPLGSTLTAGFAHIMNQMECLLETHLKGRPPSFVIVQGDTSSAAAIAATSFFHGIHVAHVEAGLRTYDLTSPFPEEFNRQLISIVASVHFPPTNFTSQILLSEGVAPDSIFMVGNPVIDAVMFATRQEHINTRVPKLKDMQKLVLLTCHRRENIPSMPEIFSTVKELVDKHQDLVVLFPVHPNPQVSDAASKYLKNHARIHLVEPFGFLDQISALNACDFVMTDSGGIQEEATALGKPCLVLRDTTERPESVVVGVTKLVGKTHSQIIAGFEKMYASSESLSPSYPFGRGDAAKRIVEHLSNGKDLGRRVRGRKAPLGRSHFEDSDFEASKLTKFGTGGDSSTVPGCEDGVHCFKDGQISVILTVYKRNTTFEVLEALASQSVPPKKIFVWQNGEFQNLDWLKRSKFANKVEIVQSTHNFKFHGRFLLPLLFDTQFTLILDDDMLPGTKVIERMRDACVKLHGLIGINGRTLNDLKNYRSQSLVGDGNSNKETQKVDYIGHGWFFETKWIRFLWQNRHYSIVNAEDIAFSASVKILGNIDSYVIGRDTDAETWPDKKREWGGDMVSSWRVESKNWDNLRLNAIRFFKARGWSLQRVE
jgi:UDP-N-acetylglucosamine 2-epimerase (non-hydrolysing)